MSTKAGELQPGAIKSLEEVLSASQKQLDWLNTKMANGIIDVMYDTCDGKVIYIANAESVEALHRAVIDYPTPLASLEVKPLMDFREYLTNVMGEARRRQGLESAS